MHRSRFRLGVVLSLLRADWCCDTPRGELQVKEKEVFFSSRGSAAELSSGWWQLLTVLGSSPFFSTPGKLPTFYPIVSPPSCFSATFLLTGSDSLPLPPLWRQMQRLRPFFSLSLLHCQCCYINRKQWSGCRFWCHWVLPPLFPKTGQMFCLLNIFTLFFLFVRVKHILNPSWEVEYNL